MNPYQLTQQIRHVLADAEWGPGVPVFGDRGVRVALGPPRSDLFPPGTPSALVVPGGTVADEDHPADLVQARFLVMLLAEVHGDALGAHTLVGGPVANLASGVGRGLLELEERVVDALGSLNGADGVALSARVVGSAQGEAVDQPSIAAMEVEVSGWCTQRLHYASPRLVERTATGVEWDGREPLARYDWGRFVVLRNGVQVAALSGGATSFDLSLNPGDVVRVRAQYRDRPGGSTSAYESLDNPGNVYTEPAP